MVSRAFSWLTHKYVLDKASNNRYRDIQSFLLFSQSIYTNVPQGVITLTVPHL